MILFKSILILFILPSIDVRIYVFNTVDSPLVEFYDCIIQDGLNYCRRPTVPIPLNRTKDAMKCYHNGTLHSFANINRDNISASIILHSWKSSVEKIEKYKRYLINPHEFSNEYICNCTKPQSFGKNCEYMLPIGMTFAETLTSEITLKRFYPRSVQLFGDIVCYRTLTCNSGLLCLDWRDICDGVQQCMLGLDEENCDKLEFNECEQDEYRCMNGMCIPEEYFLDGEFDCLDWSDEIQYYDDMNCPIVAANTRCDDRICPPNEFSCSDGQCISNRFEFQKPFQSKSQCRSRREQFYICETHYTRQMWTLPNGRCFEGTVYNVPVVHNRTNAQECEYLLRCNLSKGLEINCPCGRNSSCAERIDRNCSPTYIHYPNGGIMAPYILFFYEPKRNSTAKGPDFSWLNGTIKCNGDFYQIPSPVRYHYVSTVFQTEDALCRRVNISATLISNGSNEYCPNQSLTFNNRPYSFSNVCNMSKKCISTYRIKDGYMNCFDKMDEIDDSLISKICSKMQRYRFRCSSFEPTCLSVTTLGNLQNHCSNRFDEHWLGTSTQLANIECNEFSKIQCKILQQYIENSWKSNDTNQVTEQFRIPFRQYCNTLWNLASKEDENTSDCQKWWKCSEDQWQCKTGQCIDAQWVLDDEWDCFDGSDEDEFSDQLHIYRNLQVVTSTMLRNKSRKFNKSIPFVSICNLTIEFPCLPANISSLLFNSSYNRPCISKDHIGDGETHCYGAIDERNTITHCSQPSMLGFHFKCVSSNECIPYWNHCFGDRCRLGIDDQFWCDHRQDLINDNSFSDTVCFNGTYVKDGRCNRISDCAYGEDEYMCEHQTLTKLTGTIYRQDKETSIKNTEHKLQLNRFPTDSNFTELTTDSKTTTLTATTLTTIPNTTIPSIVFYCNRGVSVQIYDDSIACFCPPQYYGDRCQFHSNRLAILFHLNFTQSNYTSDTDVQIVLKIIVLLLFKEEVITNHISHVRPVSDLFVYTKKVAHLLYNSSIQQNQTNGSNDHPYSVRIEIYERQPSGYPLLYAVWQYPIFFDFLPVFRFAKVLRLIKIDQKQNPCSSKPCNQYQDCQPLMNDLSKYVCLCKSNYSGENCSIEDKQCTNGYCSLGSICKPNYRGLLIGNHLPYCVCPFDRLGEQCGIEYDQCLSKPCLNGGTCYSASRIDNHFCICTDEYHGKNCETRKPEIKLYINQSIQHHHHHYAAVVIQYFDIHFSSLDLQLVHQKVYQTLPSLLEYRHGQNTAPEIILAKLYSSQVEVDSEIYLLSVHINVTTISAITQLNDYNRCIHIHQVIQHNQTQQTTKSSYSPIRYHQLCEENEDLFCFRDDFYLCICNENHSRVECFRYDSKLDQCSSCYSGGRCLRRNHLESKDFICLCPQCYSGNKCQFNSNSFTFTLDQLFYTDLTSIHSQRTFQLLIIIPIVLFIIAIPNNLFSFLTFSRQNCLCNGIGQYLLSMSIINQFNLLFLVFRLIHLAINITGFHSHTSSSSIDDYLCKILNYLLTTSSRMVYWLSSLVAIERVYMTLFLNGRWLRKPHIARRLIMLIVICILISDIHEILFVESLFGINKDIGGMCVIQFPINYKNSWFLFHLIISIMNSILPFLINICCTITISSVVAKNKINIRKTNLLSRKNRIIKKQSYFIIFRRNFYFIYEILRENKELIIGPGITLVPQLFSLPLFIISFTLYCQQLEDSWIRYLLIGSYFTSFIPQLISFLLYIYPSSFYFNEWHSTNLSKWIHSLFRMKHTNIVVTKISGAIE